MMPNLFDHLLVALIAVAYPIYSTLTWYRRSRPQMETGQASARLRVYREAMLELWLLTAAVLSWWFLAGRTIAEVGLGAPGGWAFWIGVVVVVASAIALGRQIAVVRASSEARERVQSQVRSQFGVGAGLMIPRNSRERRMWVGLSLTAGFCEEVLYRAFFMWYLMAWLPAAAVVAVSAAVFGVAHYYLGWGGVFRATAMGAVLGIAYLLTGTIWVPIALHGTVDITSGLTGSAALHQGAAVAASGSSDEGHL
jgi:membrane protease YdiL (CAAX protease family)